MLVAFFLCGFWGVSPALVALAGGHLAMFAGGVPWKTLVQRICARDIVFFACLFVMVGAVGASGILDGVGRELTGIWRSSPRLGLLVVLWGAALLTTVLNAGPTTALLLHALSASHGAPVAAGQMLWWALSLGVCAGSSGTLTGATAGPVAATILERKGYSLGFDLYARTGLPVMALFLLVSSVFVLLFPKTG
jgi:Na+/H+ antiporter NhaD/arsenite permease-like protein